MATEIVMPKLGLTMTEGTIDHWLVAVGDQVTAGQPILEISSEKLTSEVESPEAGTVLKLLYADGDTVPCKQAVAIIGDASETVDESSTASPAQAPVTESQPVAVNDVSTIEPTKPRSTGRILITPVARRLAAEKGYRIEDIPGTGGNGRITRRDVEGFVPVKEAAPSVESEPARANLTGMRKTIAQRMMNSLHNSAQLTLHRKADVTGLMAMRQELKSKVEQPLDNGEISLTALITQAVIKALQEHPAVNAWFFEGDYQVQSQINIGIATALSDGLVVPVVQNADQLSLGQLGRTIKKLAGEARKGTLDSSLYAGSTFSITTLGAQGVEYFTPILNPPEIGILGVGALQKNLALGDDGEVIERTELPLSLTFDHQVLDGAPAAEFLGTVVDYLQSPYSLLL
ncbi:dihydrolipoamide acetyltransferase family protein [Limosilactobacillus gastricus]|uniref:dihydrolipoamide acetyltransferase family protein n=1 Tax=Limosilactobacillus gastricus TaxID=227942 RepID=UPI0026F16EB4|nr:dihydrolipoamide acetyltransferase family protein [Limosilactobacillus gastricus]